MVIPVSLIQFSIINLFFQFDDDNDVYLFTHEFSIDLMQATKSLDVSRGQKMPRSGLHLSLYMKLKLICVYTVFIFETPESSRYTVH